jgi:hypothetical protein
MRTFALNNGDLVLSGDRFAMIEGPARVQQQVGLCMREPWRIDRFHRGWGSVLPNMIGSTAITEQIKADIANEIRRIVANFVTSTTEDARRRVNSGLPTVVGASEILTGVTSIQIRQQQDRLYVKVTLSTMGAVEFSIITTPGGS